MSSNSATANTGSGLADADNRSAHKTSNLPPTEKSYDSSDSFRSIYEGAARSSAHDGYNNDGSRTRRDETANSSSGTSSFLRGLNAEPANMVRHLPQGNTSATSVASSFDPYQPGPHYTNVIHQTVPSHYPSPYAPPIPPSNQTHRSSSSSGGGSHYSQPFQAPSSPTAPHPDLTVSNQFYKCAGCSRVVNRSDWYSHQCSAYNPSSGRVG
jgi:hypothetical protein